MCLCVSDKVIEVRTNRMNDYYIMKGICDDMNKKIKTPEVEQLFKGMLCLKSVEECYEFFEDICTINELLTYLEIAEKTGASTATISRVNRSLNYGNDGYDMVLNRLNEE